MDVTYLQPLFEVARAFLGDSPNPESIGSFGLHEPDRTSSLAKDDEGTHPFWVSAVVAESIGAAVDHALALSVLTEAQHGRVTPSAPWTLTRGVAEPAATAVWILNGGNRVTRQERALRVWHHDMDERGKWERNLGEPPAGVRSGAARATQIIKLAGSLGLREKQVAASFNLGDTVADAGTLIGWDRKTAFARWREGSAFAHGRFWPLMRLTTPDGGEQIPGGLGMVLGFDESRHWELARLATGLLERAVDDYAAAAAPKRG